MVGEVLLDELLDAGVVDRAELSAGLLGRGIGGSVAGSGAGTVPVPAPVSAPVPVSASVSVQESREHQENWQPAALLCPAHSATAAAASGCLGLLVKLGGWVPAFVHRLVAI